MTEVFKNLASRVELGFEDKVTFGMVKRQPVMSAKDIAMLFVVVGPFCQCLL